MRWLLSGVEVGGGEGGHACRGTDAASSSLGGGQWSRGVTIHFINPVESVNFKENQARMNYLYTGRCTRGPRRSLSSLLPPIKKSHCLNSLDLEPLFFGLSKNKTQTEEDKE